MCVSWALLDLPPSFLPSLSLSLTLCLSAHVVQREPIVPFFSLLVKDIYFINESTEKM
jgi:hypothetical protein